MELTGLGQKGEETEGGGKEGGGIWAGEGVHAICLHIFRYISEQEVLILNGSHLLSSPLLSQTFYLSLRYEDPSNKHSR